MKRKVNGPDANYDFQKHKAPASPMGHGDYANMPTQAMIRPFSRTPSYRDGIVNDYLMGVEELSQVDENEK